MPLQASATSKAMAGRMITLPSRRNWHAQPRQVVLATFDASSCSGNVIWLKTMAGMGIISTKESPGKRMARRNSTREKRTVRPARTISSEKRARKKKHLGAHLTKNKYAQSNPKIKLPTRRAAALCGPAGHAPARLRSQQREERRNRCEKLGSCHHCPTRMVSVVYTATATARRA